MPVDIEFKKNDDNNNNNYNNNNYLLNKVLGKFLACNR